MDVKSVEKSLQERLEQAKQLWKEGNYLQLLELTTENVGLARQFNLFAHYIRNLTLQAAAYHELQYYQVAEEKYEQILAESSEVQQVLGVEHLHKVRYYAALNRADLGDLDGAYALLKAILGEAGSEEMKVNALVALGNVFQSLYKISGQTEYLDIAIEFLGNRLKEGNLDDGMAEYYRTTLGMLAVQKGETEEAEEMLLDVAQNTKSPYLASHAIDELAYLYIKTKQFNLADDYLKEAEDLLLKVSDRVESARNAYLRGLWYKEQHNYEKAEQYLTESAKMLEEKQVLIELVNVSYELFKLYEKVNPAKAAKYFVNCERVKEKIYIPKGV